jgi:hypothetical protein
MFNIQVSNPEFLVCEGLVVDDVFDALEYIFIENTERCIFFYSHQPLSIDYKYDMGSVLNDFLELIIQLSSMKHGEYAVGGSSNGFMYLWRLKYFDKVHIALEDDTAIHFGHIPIHRKAMSIPIEDFLSEWKSLFIFVIKVIDLSGIKMSSIVEYDAIKSVILRIDELGFFYRSSK